MKKMNSTKSDRWVRRFTTDSTHKHKNGFTIYKITSYLFPLASPEAVTVLTVWKRYSDLQMLQRVMNKMHQQLHLKGTCPTYTKWGYFRRFDPEVIQDRMKSTQSLLEFIANHPPLFTSTEFVRFFQSSYPDPDVEEGNTGNIESIRRSLLLPVEVIGPLDHNQTSEDDSFSTQDSNSVSPFDGVSPEEHNIVYRNDAGQPIATYPKSPRISNVNNIGKLEDVAEIVVLPDPLPPQTCDNSTTIKVNDVENTSINGSEQSQSNVPSSMETSVENVEKVINNLTKLNLPDLLTFDTQLNMDVSQISSDSSTDSLSFLDSPSFNSTNDNDLMSFTKPSESVMSLQLGLTNDQSTDSNERLRKRSVPNVAGSRDKVDGSSYVSSRSTSRLDTVSIDSLFGSTADLQESYVFEAGYLLSLGARNEVKGEYQKAFDFYKAGIEKMLIGVQGDTNEYRRQFVRDKTNKYLSYAEKIYTNHLNNPDNMMPEMSSGLTPAAVYRPLKICDVSSLRHPYKDLSKFKVLGIIGGQVMLVLCTDTQNYYAMKVIQKSCNQIPDEDFFKSPEIDSQLPVMPIDIPYMVKLVSFIDTPNLLFLVLQYASGGKLFDYIKNYVKTVTETPKREVNLENIFVDLEEMAKKRNETKQCDDILELETKNDEVIITAISSPDNLNLSVSDIVNNSQRLLLNVDDALNGRFKKERDSVDCKVVDSSVIVKCTMPDKTACKKAEDDAQERMEGVVIDDSIKFRVLGNRSALSPKSLCNWGAELLTAIDHLHQCGVYCRNLNPDNLLLGEQGHLVLSYMVGWNARESLTKLMNQDKLLCDVYIAPEIQRFPLLDSSYDERLADFWSFGAIMYELLTGLPLSITHPTGFNSHTILNIPEGLSEEAESLLSQLLCYDPYERIGSGPDGIKDIKSHPYFRPIDWDHVEHIYDEESYY